MGPGVARGPPPGPRSDAPGLSPSRPRASGSSCGRPRRPCGAARCARPTSPPGECARPRPPIPSADPSPVGKARPLFGGREAPELRFGLFRYESAERSGVWSGVHLRSHPSEPRGQAAVSRRGLPQERGASSAPPGHGEPGGDWAPGPARLWVTKQFPVESLPPELPGVRFKNEAFLCLQTSFYFKNSLYIFMSFFRTKMHLFYREKGSVQEWGGEAEGEGDKQPPC